MVAATVSKRSNDILTTVSLSERLYVFGALQRGNVFDNLHTKQKRERKKSFC